MQCNMHMRSFSQYVDLSQYMDPTQLWVRSSHIVRRMIHISEIIIDPLEMVSNSFILHIIY